MEKFSVEKNVPIRTFIGDESKNASGLNGPEAIANDIDSLLFMLDPEAEKEIVDGNGKKHKITGGITPKNVHPLFFVDYDNAKDFVDKLDCLSVTLTKDKKIDTYQLNIESIFFYPYLQICVCYDEREFYFCCSSVNVIYKEPDESGETFDYELFVYKGFIDNEAYEVKIKIDNSPERIREVTFERDQALLNSKEIYWGTELPTDPYVRLWFDPDGEDVPDSLAVPAYCEYEAVRVAGVISEKISELKRAEHRYITFGAVTDNHVANKHKWIDSNGELNEITALQDVLTKASIRHGAYALKYVSDLVGCDFIANLGDNNWENNIDTDNAYTAGSYTRDTLLPAFDVDNGGCFGFHLVGNHDQTNNIDRQWELIGKYNNFDETGATPERCYGYKDFIDKKVRVICLNTSDYLNGTGGYGMSYEQKSFLMSSLDLSDKEDCADWKILLLSHIPLDFYSSDYNITADIIGILNAYVSGGSVSITVNDAWAGIHDDTTSGILTYDYNGKNTAQIIGNIHGHLHNDCHGKLGYTDTSGNTVNTQLTRVSTPNTCFYLAKSTAYANNGDYEGILIPKVQGAAQDTIATFYVVDLTDNVIFSYVYGAGNDRVIDYTPKDSEEPIEPDEPEVELPYTNLFDEDTATAPMRFGSSGEIVAGNYWCMSTYLPVEKGDIVRVYCPNGIWTEHDQRVIASYDSNKTHLESDFYSVKNETADVEHLFTVTISEDVSYIRVSGLPYNNLDGVIITINEKIV